MVSHCETDVFNVYNRERIESFYTIQYTLYTVCNVYCTVYTVHHTVGTIPKLPECIVSA